MGAVNLPGERSTARRRNGSASHVCVFVPAKPRATAEGRGPDLRRFPTEKHFTSWLGLCPDNRISGGKVLSCRTRRVVNRLSDALRLAATTLEHSPTALGAFYRRMKGKLGAAEGITATAHKLARILYRLIKHGEGYVRQGLADYEQKHQARKLKGLQKAAESIGFELVRKQPLAPCVS